MQIGIFGGDVVDRGVGAVVEAARTAHEQGFAAFWLPQIFGIDALTTLAIVGREVPDIQLGTGVVPTYPRHPLMLAAQALTVQQASGNRLVLGIGLSHRLVIEDILGYSFARPVRHMSEYLEVLTALVRTGSVAFDGEELRVHGTITVAGAAPCPILVAALGPKMLELAGTVADGTLTWMTGPATVAALTVPTITAAAEAAGRPAPRVGVGLPICVTDDVDGARARAARLFKIYGSLPSYRAMLDREGAGGPEDVVIVGNEAEVRDRVAHLDEIGATDFVAAEFGASAEERGRTRELLRTLL